jgi:tetratricopeptide (TPR) repeat protein
MIREEYAALPPAPQEDRGGLQRPRRGAIRRYRSWLWRLGGLLLLAVVGLVCTGIVDSSGIKAQVLAQIANACSGDGGVLSLVEDYRGASTKSHGSVAVCQELVRLKPDDAGAQVMLGKAYTDTGQTKEAMACYQHALALDPNCFEAHLGTGKAHFDQGSYHEAIASYQRALKIRPRSAEAHLALGLALSNAGQYEEAIQAFQKAKELDPAVVESHVMTGQACLQAGLCAQAIECFKNAVQADQSYAQAYFNLGRAYLRVGDKSLALEQQRILQDLNPTLADQLLGLISP